MTSEELIERYRSILADGTVTFDGEVCGDYESFAIGQSTLTQLTEAHIIPPLDYREPTRRPDGLIVDRNTEIPRVILVIERKNIGEMSSNHQIHAILQDCASKYNHQLGCELLALTDGNRNVWALIDLDSDFENPGYIIIHRSPGVPLSHHTNTATDQEREQLRQIISSLLQNRPDRATGVMTAPEECNPLDVLEPVWTLLRGFGLREEQSLAAFLELIIFKFLSDVGVSFDNGTGDIYDYDYVHSHNNPEQKLGRYIQNSRPVLQQLLPNGNDGTSPIIGFEMLEDGVPLWDAANPNHSRIFSDVLGAISQGGVILRLAEEFKHRVIENFLRFSHEARDSNAGTFFTPRNVCTAMLRMAQLETLPPNSILRDDSCGTGGLLVSTMIQARSADYPDAQNTLTYRGSDNNPLYTSFAKANMFLHLSTILENDPVNGCATVMAIVNDSIECTANQNPLGSLQRTPQNQAIRYVSNPPFTAAVGDITAALGQNAAVSAAYSTPGTKGKEGYFVEKMIRDLLPTGRGIILVPAGVLARSTGAALRELIRSQCILEAIVPLPRDTIPNSGFLSYILVVRKKNNVSEVQNQPVFSYAISEIGESRDYRRAPIPENDMTSMAFHFTEYLANPEEYAPPDDDPRCRVFQIDDFSSESEWLVDKMWSNEARLGFGWIEPYPMVDLESLAEQFTALSQSVTQVIEDLGEPVNGGGAFRNLELSNQNYFALTLGPRYVAHEYGTPGVGVPVYSTNPDVVRGWLPEPRLNDFSRPSVLYSVDGGSSDLFVVRPIDAGVEFEHTDHCGRIVLLSDQLDVNYVAHEVRRAGIVREFGRITRSNLTKMRALTIRVPVDADNNPDFQRQSQIAQELNLMVDGISQLSERIREIENQLVVHEYPFEEE